MKVILGFILGIMTASAIAQSDPGIPSGFNDTVQMAGGEGSDGKAHHIQVDAYGYVICSQMPAPAHWIHGGDHNRRDAR